MKSPVSVGEVKTERIAVVTLIVKGVRIVYMANRLFAPIKIRVKYLANIPARKEISRGVGSLRLWVFRRFACGCLILFFNRFIKNYMGRLFKTF